MSATQFYLPYRIAAKPTNVGAPGAKMYVYAPGTTTLRPVYASSALTTQLSNPVVADGAGRFPDVWLNNALTYKLVFKDKSGATLDTFDPYLPGQAPDSTTLQPYTVAASASAVSAAASASAAAADALSAATAANATAATVASAADLLAMSGFYNTKADATAALTSIAANAIVMVLADESDAGRRNLYRKEGGVLVLRAHLDGPRIICVDGIAGDDTAEGVTPGTALKTISTALLTGTSDLALCGPSLFRESVTDVSRLSTADSDDPPTVDGSDVATGWTAHATAANVWEKAGFTHDAPSSTDRLTIYEDGELLTRVADVATCSSTVGSFVDVRASAGFTVTLRIHTTGSDNPNSNGKVYEASKRLEGVHLGDNAKAYGPLVVRRAITASGSIRVGINCRVSRILSLDGTKHNFFMGSGEALDCIAFGNDAPPPADEPSSTMFVSFNSVTTGLSYLYERCGAIRPFDGMGGTTAWLAHSDSNATNYDSGIIRQCWVVGTQNLGHPGGVLAANALMEGCFTKTGTIGPGFGTARYCMAYSPYVNAEVNLFGEFGACTVEQFAGYFEERAANGNANEILEIRNTSSIANSVFAGSSLTGTTILIANSAATGTLTFDHSINYSLGYAFMVPTGQAYVGDYNVFFIRNNFVLSTSFVGDYHGTQYLTLSAWQTATGQDAHSVYLAAADQTAGGANAFWLAYANAAGGTSLSTIGPAVGDFRINPSARVYQANGTARIGTYDGTVPITNAGPQAHWDWNARGVASGPPTAFPNVPTTQADGERYIAGPRAWQF